MSFINTYEDYHFLFKLILVGDSCVGKSNLLLRFSENSFSSSFQPTIGVDFKIKTLKIDNYLIKLQIWDTAGQERFRTISSTYYKGAHAILLLYDITNKHSFEHIDEWIIEIQKFIDLEKIAGVLIGNKSDLNEKRCVRELDGKEKAEKLGMGFLETSAKDNINVENAFEYIIRESIRINKKKGDVKQKNKELSKGEKLILAQENKKENKKSCC